MTKCWRCGGHLILHPSTGNCDLCGYSQDLDYIQNVRIKKMLHEATERDPQSNGADRNYQIKSKWSMKD